MNRLTGLASVVVAALAFSAHAELTVGSLTSGTDVSAREIVLPYGARAVVFTNAAGPLTFTVNGNWNLLRVLVVGGGGSGGRRQGGGGGAGGYIELDYRTAPIACPDGTAFDLRVGAGGPGHDYDSQGTTGGTSTVVVAGNTYTALGGGGGGKWNGDNNTKTPCASSGGGNNTSGYSGKMEQEPPGLAYPGGGSTAHYLGGGGGGAGGPGTKNTGSNGHGGPGRYSDITGELALYAAGGGGKPSGKAGGYTAGAGDINGGDAWNGTGSGGGGGDSGGRSGSGGSGTVILLFEKDADQKFELDAVPDVTYGAAGPLPSVTVRDKSSHAALTEGTDYTLSYALGARYGEATLYVKGKGATYGTSGCSRTYRFKTTHVWTGGDTTAPNDFHTAANWSDADGNAVAAPPGASDSFFIGPVGDAAASVTATGAVTVTAFFLGARTNETVGATLTMMHGGTNTVACDTVIYRCGNLTHAELPSTVTTLALEATQGYRLALRSEGDVRIDELSSVNVSLKGFTAQNPSAYGGGNYSGTGASHGGLNLLREFGTYNPGPLQVYDSVYTPSNCGAGGWSGRGGGAVWLSVANRLCLNGAVRSDGENGSLEGSGGGVFLRCGTLTGCGAVSVNGGQNRVGGNAGRIAVHQTVATDFAAFTGTLSARVFGADVQGPGPGTVYLRTAGQRLEEGTLIVDNAGVGLYSTSVAELTEDEAEFGSVIVRNKGVLYIRAGQKLKIRDRLVTNGGTFTNAPSSVLDFSSSTNLYLSGTNFFHHFVYTNASGTLTFAAGDGNLFGAYDDGTMTIAGTNGAPVTLRSGTAGTKWYMKLGVNVSKQSTFECLTVTDSDATAGESPLGIDCTGCSGNAGWGFSGKILPGDPITWNGSTDDNWTTPDNWTDKAGGHRAPVATDDVTIPATIGTGAHWPQLRAGTTGAARLTVAGELTLDGGNLVCVDALKVSGALTACGTETITCSNEVSFTGGTYAGARATLRLAGGNNQAVDPAGQPFGVFEVLKSDGKVTFADGLAAQTFFARADGAFEIAFASGKTVSCTNFFAAGAVTNVASLTLGTAGSGVWKLAVTGERFASGVKVSDSDASGGLAIPADTLSSGSGATSGWTFTDTARFWTGAKNTTFAEKLNWLPNTSAPAAGTRILIAKTDGATTVTISAAATTGPFATFAPNAAITLNVDQTFSVTGNLEIGENTSAYFNRAVTVDGGFLLREGALLTHAGPNATLTSYVNLTASGDVTFDSRASVDVLGKGHSAGAGTGAGGGRPVPLRRTGGAPPIWPPARATVRSSRRRPTAPGDFLDLPLRPAAVSSGWRRKAR